MEETKDLHKTKLIHYSFFINEELGQECICLGLGSLFNHSPNYNIITIRSEKLATITFKTNQRIKKDTELFIDYNYDLELLEEELVKNKLNNI